MRQAVAALVAARALTSIDETPSPPRVQPVGRQALRVSRRRRTLWWTWVLSSWKTTHALG
jgi:hypothetical protein